MKVVFSAMLALMLASCATLNPMQPTARVTPVVETVPTETVTTEVAVVAPVTESLTIGEALPEPVEVESENLAQVQELLEITAPAIPTGPVTETLSQKELNCMALAIYFEARGESERGQAGVGYTVLNRVKSGKYPTTICGVVYQRGRRGCQFSWVCDKLSDYPRQQATFAKNKIIAERVMRGQIANPVGRSLYFDGYIHGRAAKLVSGYTQIGNHRFFAAYR